MARFADAETMYDEWFWAVSSAGGNPKMAWDQLPEPEKAAWRELADRYLEVE